MIKNLLKKVLWGMLPLAVLLFCGCTKENGTSDDNKSKVLVAYFSFSNTTKGVAEQLADVTDGDIYRITPVFFCSLFKQNSH